MGQCNYFAVELAVAARRPESALACDLSPTGRRVADDPLGRDQPRSPRERPGLAGVRCDRPTAPGIESMRGRGWAGGRLAPLLQTLHSELIMGLGWDERVSRPLVFHLPMRRTVTASAADIRRTGRQPIRSLCNRQKSTAFATPTIVSALWMPVLAGLGADLIEYGKLSRRQIVDSTLSTRFICARGARHQSK